MEVEGDGVGDGRGGVGYGGGGDLAGAPLPAKPPPEGTREAVKRTTLSGTNFLFRVVIRNCVDT